MRIVPKSTRQRSANGIRHYKALQTQQHSPGSYAACLCDLQQQATVTLGARTLGHLTGQQWAEAW